MATCGYICPRCEGRGYNELGEICQWCSSKEELSPAKNKEAEEWIKQVHEGPCCGDFSAKSEGL